MHECLLPSEKHEKKTHLLNICFLNAVNNQDFLLFFFFHIFVHKRQRLRRSYESHSMVYSFGANLMVFHSLLVSH